MGIKLYLNTSVITHHLGYLLKLDLFAVKSVVLSQCIVSQKMYVFCIRKLNEFLTVNSSVGKIQVQSLKNCGNCLLYSLKALLFLGGLELGMFC